MKGKVVVGRVVGWTTWHHLDPSQVEVGESRHSTRTVWVRPDKQNQHHFTGICIHTGQRRVGSLRDIHTVMPDSYSHT